jgi:hypothetical protein
VADAASSPSRSRWLHRRSLLAHGALLVWIPGCAVAAWWQVGIALGGDSLGWVYSVMWPCFAVFGIVFWWFLVHDDPETVGARALRHRAAADAAAGTEGATTPDEDDGAAQRLARAEAEDPELAAYNEYLSALAEQDKSWRRR